MKKITVKIKNGKSTVHTEGFVGSECKDATRALEEALGKVESDENTEEMYADDVRDELYEAE